MPIKRFFIVTLLLLAAGYQLQAQIRIQMRIPRRLYITYEPLIVTVAIANLSGHDLVLNDADGQKWFSFQVTTGDGRIIPPLNLDYHLEPLTIPAGEMIKRNLNLAALYAVQEFGLYRVKASVYLPETQKYYSSDSSQVEITDGKMIWQQTVGVPSGQPGAGSYRTVSLLTHRREQDNELYIRIEDKEGGIVYVTSPLGRLLLSMDPQVEFDKENQVNVLQLIGAKTYEYTKMSLNGEVLNRITYNAVNTRPILKKAASGEVTVVGGEPDIPVPPSAPSQPKLSDRPPGLPKI
jgi:hypothetical protein